MFSAIACSGVLNIERTMAQKGHIERYIGKGHVDRYIDKGRSKNNPSFLRLCPK